MYPEKNKVNGYGNNGRRVAHRWRTIGRIYWAASDGG